MNPGIDFFHLPCYASSWLDPNGRHALRVCPESDSTTVPALAWALKEAAWKSLPDPVQPSRFHPSQFNLLECKDQQAKVEFQADKRVLELKYIETNQGFLAYSLPESYSLYLSIPEEYSKAQNGRPMLLSGSEWVPISISHDGPFGYAVLPD
jgi:phosphopantetheinyl transferase (holo-ACP synthase)